MTLDDLTINFSTYDPKDLVSDWVWLIGKTKFPVLVSALGNIFVQDKKNGSVHFLNLVDGTLTEVAKNGDDFRALLSQKEFVVEYFSVQLIGDLRASGKVLGKNKVYSFIVPPVLGGEYSLDNIEQCDCNVNMSLAGQIHRQVKDLPDGAKISDIKVEQPKKPKWKFWG